MRGYMGQHTAVHFRSLFRIMFDTWYISTFLNYYQVLYFTHIKKCIKDIFWFCTKFSDALKI